MKYPSYEQWQNRTEDSLRNGLVSNNSKEVKITGQAVGEVNFHAVALKT